MAGYKSISEYYPKASRIIKVIMVVSRLLFLIPLLLPCLTLAQSFEGRVVGVADGDTITVLTEGNKQVKVRLAEIDAPEKAQPFGQKSKQYLSDMVFNKQVRIDQQDLDQYDRIVGRVYSPPDWM